MIISGKPVGIAVALQYIDEETHTWTTEDFIKAVSALVAYGQEHVGVVYCKNQSGDQGTRALVNNLYGGSFTPAVSERQRGPLFVHRGCGYSGFHHSGQASAAV